MNYKINKLNYKALKWVDYKSFDRYVKIYENVKVWHFTNHFGKNIVKYSFFLIKDIPKFTAVPAAFDKKNILNNIEK